MQHINRLFAFIVPLLSNFRSISLDCYSDIDKTCPTCGSALHAFWWSTSGAEVEVEISDTGKIKIPAGAGAIAHIDLKCKSCGYEKKETRLLGLDFGAEKPGNYTLDKMDTTNAGANIPAAGGRNPKGYGDEGKANVNSNGKEILWVEPFGIDDGRTDCFFLSPPYLLRQIWLQVPLPVEHLSHTLFLALFTILKHL